jgi:hypothetical protein
MTIEARIDITHLRQNLPDWLERARASDHRLRSAPRVPTVW